MKRAPGRPSRAELWQHFQYNPYDDTSACLVKITKDDGSSEIPCGNTVRSGKSTGNLEKHLERYHPEIYEEVQIVKEVRERFTGGRKRVKVDANHQTGQVKSSAIMLPRYYQNSLLLQPPQTSMVPTYFPLAISRANEMQAGSSMNYQPVRVPSMMAQLSQMHHLEMASSKTEHLSSQAIGGRVKLEQADDDDYGYGYHNVVNHQLSEDETNSNPVSQSNALPENCAISAIESASTPCTSDELESDDCQASILLPQNHCDSAERSGGYAVVGAQHSGDSAKHWPSASMAMSSCRNVTMSPPSKVSDCQGCSKLRGDLSSMLIEVVKFRESVVSSLKSLELRILAKLQED